MKSYRSHVFGMILGLGLAAWPVACAPSESDTDGQLDETNAEEIDEEPIDPSVDDEPPPLEDSYTIEGHAGACRVTTSYTYSGDTAVAGTVTITSPDSVSSVTMQFDGDETSFGFSFGAASGRHSGGQESWDGDDTPGDANHAWLEQCGDDYTPVVAQAEAGAGFEPMADCTNYRNRYLGDLRNRDRAASRASSDRAISIGSAVLAVSPARYLRWGLFGVKGTRLGLLAAGGAADQLQGQNAGAAGMYAGRANAHCDGWKDCCAQPGGPHTWCPAACSSSHGPGRES